MNIDELKAMPTAEAIRSAAQYAGVRPEVIDRMWLAESRRGTHPTMVSEVGAEGHFQQMPHMTDAWSSRLGRRLDPFSFHDSLAMTASQLKENMKRYGNERQAVLAYHGGTNQKAWGPKTQKYADLVVSGGDDNDIAAINDFDPMKSNLKGRTVPAGFDPMKSNVGLVAQQQDAARGTVGVSPVPQPGELGPYSPDTSVVDQATKASEATLQAPVQLAANTTFGQQVGAAYRTMTDPTFRAIARLTGEIDGVDAVDPVFRKDLANNWQKYEEGFTEDERQKLRGSHSKKDYDIKVQEILTYRKEQEVINANGTGSAIGASLLAGLADPVSWAAGLGATKVFSMAGVGTTALARAGRPAAATASFLAESAAGNVGYEMVQDMLGEYRSPGDYGIAGATGLLIPVPFSRHVYKQAIEAGAQAAAHEAALLSKRVIDTEVARQAALAEQAIKNVGPEASPEARIAEMQRLDAEQINEKARGAFAAAPESDRIPAINLDEPAMEAPKADEMRGVTATEVDPNTVDLSMFEPETPKYKPEDFTNYGRGEYLSNVKNHVDAYFDTAAPNGKAAFKDAHGITVSKTDFQATADKPGVHVDPSLMNEPLYKNIAATIEEYRKQMLPDVSLYLTKGGTAMSPSTKGAHIGAGPNHSVIALRPGSDVAITATHEFGHAVLAHKLLTAPTAVRNAMLDEFMKWRQAFDKSGDGAARKATLQRSPLTSHMTSDFAGRADLLDESPFMDPVVSSLRNYMSQNMAGDATKKAEFLNYFTNFDEVGAEQFVKFVEQSVINKGPLSVPQQVLKKIKEVVSLFLDLFKQAKRDNLLDPMTSFQDFFNGILRGQEGPATGVTKVVTGEAPTVSEARSAMNADPIAVKYGLDKMPQGTPVEKAEFKAVLDLYKKAEEWNRLNPRDDERVKTMLNNAPFQSVAMTGSLLALSDNPLARMVAGTLLENTTGAMGRRSTAALSKFAHEQTFMGNSINEYEAAFQLWAQSNGHGTVRASIDNLAGGDLTPAFHRLVAEEIEARRSVGGETSASPAVQRAANAIEQAYERMRVAQVDTKTVGWARLPNTARGYMPHSLSKERVMTLTDPQQRAFIDVLEKQFMDIEGMDQEFAGELARKYLDHARVNALGGHEIPANIHNPAAADMVRGALQAMGMSRDEVAAMMGRYSAGGPSHTKKRLQLDLNATYPDGVGGEFKLMDLFETDQLQLLRNYSRRVSGEVALAQYGVMGSQGLSLIRRGLMFGDHGKAEPARVMEAFDQVGAEFLGRPFGDAGGKWMDRALTATAAARLGGMVFNQFAESINMFTHLGAEHAMTGIASLPRMRAELTAIAKGQKVDNGILSSLEQWGGVGEFGSEGYKLVMPFDDTNSAYRTYGSDTVTTLDRVLRGAGHAQGVLTGWRALHAAQTRTVAEQIVLKSVRYVRDGLESAALADMGINASLAARIKNELPHVATFDSAGRVVTLDFTKAQDETVARDWALATLRGSRQIIQGTFIGETGKWAHDGWLRLFAQFKTFGIVSMEKQWARNKANFGVAGALGILLGSMAAAAPIYYARVALAAQGREDKEEYIAQRTTPAMIARATLNYIPMAGLSGDLVDALSAVGGGAYKAATGDALPEWAKTTGGRAGVPTDFLGGQVAPAAGLVDDAWKALQTPNDPHKAAMVLPGSRIWWLTPAINGLKD